MDFTDDIIKVEESEPYYSTAFHDENWMNPFLIDDPEETGGDTSIMPIFESPAAG